MKWNDSFKEVHHHWFLSHGCFHLVHFLVLQMNLIFTYLTISLIFFMIFLVPDISSVWEGCIGELTLFDMYDDIFFLILRVLLPRHFVESYNYSRLF